MSGTEAYNGADGRRDPGFIGRMWAMIVKEFVQMRRDRMTFATMLFVPILQLTLFGFAINTDPKDLPTAVLVREKAGLAKAANNPGSEVAGSITEAQLEEIATIKLPDLNAYDLEAAKLQVRGTARSMGIKVV